MRWTLVPLRTAKDKARGRRGGEMGQMAFHLAISARNPDLLAMGIDTAAVYVSEDGGRNWEIRRRGIHSNGVQSVAFDPVDPRVMWAAGLRSAAGTRLSFPPDPRYYDRKADGIYRSDDLGRTWRLVRHAAFLRNHAQNTYFAFDPASGKDGSGCRTVYAITHDAGLLKTTDGGETWRRIGPKGVLGNAILRHPITGRLWFAADKGLWRSDDAGASWTRAGLSAAPVLGLAVDPRTPDVVLAACGVGGVWRSADGGLTWRRSEAGLPRNVRWVQVVMSSVDPRIVYVDATRWGGPVPYYSRDGGRTWHPMTFREPDFYGNGVYWGEGLAAHPRDPLVAFHLNPVRKTTDGGRTWRLIGNGVCGSRRATRSGAAFRPDDPDKFMFFHIDHGAALTTDGGDTWRYVSAPRQKDLGAKTMPGGAYDPTPGSRTVISAVGGWTRQRLCITHDDGQTWKVWPDMVDNYVFFAWHPQDARVVYVGTKGGGLRSDDRGRTWKRIGKPLRAILPSNGDIVYAVTPIRKHRWSIERSIDRGETWAPLGKPLPYAVLDIDVDPRNPDRVYAATAYGGIWIFDGRKWTARGEKDGLVKDYFGAMIFRSIAVDPVHPDVVYAGQNHCWRGVARGVFRSVDSGRTWTNINGNFGPELTVWAISVSPHDGTVWLGTDYGNWRTEAP